MLKGEIKVNNYNSPCYAAAMHTNHGMQNRHTRADSESSCTCTKPRFPTNTAYAMAYVPFQQSGEVYACDRALMRGTAFPCLDLPFLKGCCK